MRTPLPCIALLPALLICCLPPGRAAAQTQPTPTGSAQPPAPAADVPRPVFPGLFPQPTGRNGYEDLVMAGDTAKSSKLLESALADGAALTAKRQALSDPLVARALLLLRAALDKPVESPHQHIDENTPLPELALFRTLARLIAIQEYVFFADGRTTEALESMRTGLRMGYVIQTDTLISGLVGISCDAIVVNPVAEHLDQLTAGNCERLVAFVNDWLISANRAPEILAAESNLTVSILNKYRSDPDGLQELLKTVTALPDTDPNASNLADVVQAEVKGDPTRSAALIDGAVAVVHSITDASLANLTLPPWARKPMKVPDGDSLALQIVDALGGRSISEAAQNKYTLEQVQMQLLAVHAAIHRYRWEYNRLPGSLAVLRVGALAIDPFTGKTLGYDVRSGDYDLYSAGPFKHDPNGVITGAQGRIYFPRKS